MAITYTQDAFDRLSWHDCHVWRLELRSGDPERQDWTADLVLDLDYIVEWICQTDGTCRFRVAPATLAFHQAGDLRIGIDWRLPGQPAWLHELSIDSIVREPAPSPNFHHWTIRLNWLRGGLIAFTASGFTQVLHSEGLLTDRQKLTPSERAGLLAPGRP